MDKINTWQWILLLLGFRALLEFIPLPDVHDLYGVILTSTVLILIWRKLNYQEALLRPFIVGVLIYWFGYIFDYLDGLLNGQGYWGKFADTVDDLLFAIGFCLIGLTFLRVMNNRNHLIEQLHTENARSRALQQSLYQQAYTDELTGLGNRRALFECLAQKLQTGESGTLLYIDVNNFKPVNDQFGHDVGDLVLQRCARKLSYQGALAFRLGGDEFVALLEQQNPQQWIRDLSEHAQRLSAEYGISFSVGMAQFSAAHPVSTDELLAQADQAMYSEKTAAKTRQR